MKISILSALSFCILLFSCKVSQKTVTPIVESKSIAGIWQLEKNFQKVNTYKVINPDGTFFNMFTGMANSAGIGVYGNYKLTSDSTMVEHITKSDHMPTLNGTTTDLRFKFVDENTILASYKNPTLKNPATQDWIFETWKRLPLYGQKPVAQKNVGSR